MINKHSYLLILISVVLFSCGQKSGRAIEKRLTGLNGPCIYYFDDSDNLMMVQKEEYYTNPNHNVMINNDSITLGNEFSSLFFTDPYSRISIHEPEIKLLEVDSAGKLVNFKYAPKTVGLYNLKGNIEHDSTIASFEYKFIVLPKE